MSVNPISVQALKDGEHYWLYAPAIMGHNDDPVVIGQYARSCDRKSKDLWWAAGHFYGVEPGIIPISHIKKPKWKPK